MDNLTGGNSVVEALLTLIHDICEVLLSEELHNEDRRRLIRAISRALATGI